MKPESLPIASLLGMLLWSPASAATLRECLALAQAHDPASRSDSLASEGARIQSQAAKANWRPSVGASLTFNRLSEMESDGVELPLPAALGGPRQVEIAKDIPNQYLASVRLDQLVWDGGRSSHLDRAAQHDSRAWDAARERSRRDLAVRVATSYWSLQAAQATYRSALSARDRAASQAAWTVANFRQGTALEQDTLQARLRTGQIELQIEQAAASRDLARDALCVALGMATGCAMDATDSLRTWQTTSDTAGERPELAQVREQILSATETADAGRSVFQPTVQASAQYDYARPNQRMVPARDQFDASWRVGVNATWNLYRGGADELSIRRAELAVRTAREREILTRDQISQDIARRATELALAIRRREIAERNLPLARRDLELSEIRSRAGTALALEAIDRAWALSQAQAELSQALAAENAARLQAAIARGQRPAIP